MDGGVGPENQPANDLEAAGVTPEGQQSPIIDPFGRSITYLRVSVTDRCDLRCVYCMAEHMAVCRRVQRPVRGAPPNVRRKRREV